MSQLFDALGLDAKILIAQLVNFAVLLAVLYKFGYKPILKFVTERTAKIEKGINDAEEAKRVLHDAKAEQDKLLTAARKEAQEILEKAHQHAKAQSEELKEKTKADLRDIAERAKAAIHDEREKILAETRSEAVGLVLQATEKVLQEKLDAKADQALVERYLKQ
jgi:F-type H+-transporting ATPase subunit b